MIHELRGKQDFPATFGCIVEEANSLDTALLPMLHEFLDGSFIFRVCRYGGGELNKLLPIIRGFSFILSLHYCES